VADSRHLDVAGHDELTGLPRFESFRRCLPVMLGERGSAGLLLGIVELNGLDSMDSHLGEGCGDAAMFLLADRLNDTLPPAALLSRIDHKQLWLAIPNISDVEAREWDARLRSVAATPAFVGGLELVLDTVIGLVHATSTDMDEAELLAQATVAVMRARDEPNRTMLIPAVDGNISARYRVLASFARALRSGEGLELHHQPQVSLDSMSVVGVESLIRWTDRTGLSVAPAEFIPAVEQTPLIGPLTDWVLQRAARDMLGSGTSLPRVAVNISARSLAEPDFVEQVVRAFCGGSGQEDLTRLDLEITETALMSAPDRARRHLVVLRSLGATVSLDDFGTGFSSLGVLRDLPLDTIKIDRTFVGGLEHDPTARRLIDGMVDLAHALDLAVLAEGIETQAALEIVAESGCDIGQGYYLGVPQPVSQLVDNMLTLSPDSAAAQ